MLLEYAAQHSWEVYDIYSDDNYTGSDRNRPAFTRLLEDAEDRRFDIILCKSQSRFTRELELVEKYINGLFPIWDIRFISLVDNADTSNKGNKKAASLLTRRPRQWSGKYLSSSLRDTEKTAIARLLNERGIPNPTEYKRLHGLRYQQPKQIRHPLEIRRNFRHTDQRALYRQSGLGQIWERFL